MIEEAAPVGQPSEEAADMAAAAAKAASAAAAVFDTVDAELQRRGAGLTRAPSVGYVFGTPLPFERGFERGGGGGS